MKPLLVILAIALLAAGAGIGTGTSSPPGEQPKPQARLAPERLPPEFERPGKGVKLMLVVYSASWCPGCQAWVPWLERELSDPRCDDLGYDVIDIGSFDSEIAVRDRVPSVPELRIYDATGTLVAEGDAADARLEQELRQRLAQ